MNFDNWTNTQSGVTIGNNGPFGSPRGWVSRSINEKLFADSASLKTDTTLDHREITCGAIFPRGVKLPVFNERVLYRFFHMPKGYNGAGGGRAKDYHDQVAIVGIALAVDPSNLMKYESALRRAGALWVWFSMPVPIKLTEAKSSGPRSNARYDYVQIYKWFEQGLRVCDIVPKIPGASQPAISWIRKRWENGLPPEKRSHRQVPLDHEEVLASYRAGEEVQSIATRLNATRQGIYNVLKKYDIDYRRTGTDN